MSGNVWMFSDEIDDEDFRKACDMDRIASVICSTGGSSASGSTCGSSL